MCVADLTDSCSRVPSPKRQHDNRTSHASAVPRWLPRLDKDQVTTQVADIAREAICVRHVADRAKNINIAPVY